MPRLICINASPMGDQSRSRALLDALSNEWRHIGTVELINLAEAPPPFVSAAYVEAAYTPPEARDPAMTEALAYSDAGLAALRRADAIAVASPMHNFGPPASLKAWLDQIIRPHESFIMTDDPDAPFRGLLNDRPVALLTSRGTSPPIGCDYLHPTLTALFSLIGIHSLTTIELTGTDEPTYDAVAQQQRAQEAIATFLRPFQPSLKHVA